MVAIAWYLVLVLISVLVNLPSPKQVLVGAKIYLFIWGLFFFLIVSALSPERLEQIWKAMLIIAILQLPLTLYQRLFEVGRRQAQGVGFKSVDAVVGTFPGAEGGGASGAMAMFCVFAMALALSLRRNKTIGTPLTVLVVLACLVAIGLGEVKIIIVIVPLAFLVMGRREVVQRPLYFIGLGLVVLALLGGILTLYSVQQDESRGVQTSTLDYLSRGFGYSSDPNNYDASGYVGRGASLALWYGDPRRTPQTLLFGYGPAASQASDTGKGVVSSRYAPLKVNSTTAAGMLWDIGVLGLAGFLAIPVIAFFAGLRLSDITEIPPFHRSALEGSALMMALAVVMVPYQRYLLSAPQFQVLFLLALFQIVYWHSWNKRPHRPRLAP
jgi:hypothetical protein